ncbi:DUF72 domain-containing protein [Variovorax sp. YR752]|uniref:DUF72 domain-containing protein n=1 Tax=Variovorax sp. YR752 TaxID=1884383 RepID=UPI0031379243
MQDDLFSDGAPPPAARLPRARRSSPVEAATPEARQLARAGQLPARLHLGTSSWSYPGWAGKVWAGEYSESLLARQGLAAYARHPLLRCVGIDRTFYRALSSAQYAGYAAQVPGSFRFLVKAPSAVTDALVRDDAGRGLQANPLFLDPLLAVRDYAEPALAGLGARLGALVFQLSPLPASWLADLPALFERLATMLAALPDLAPSAADAVVAVQVRNRELLGPAFAEVLRRAGATYCLGLHASMPPIEEQLPMLRALWPGPLVCRWNLHRRHGAHGYEKARRLYEPYDHIADADPQTRAALARVALATCAAGWPAYIAIGNKAEGCAPESVFALAEAIATAGGP